jgi:hypothetical protein
MSTCFEDKSRFFGVPKSASLNGGEWITPHDSVHKEAVSGLHPGVQIAKKGRLLYGPGIFDSDRV